VKRWVVERRARRGGQFQKDRGRPLTTLPFVPGECWTPLKLRGSSVIDWKCRRGRTAAGVRAPPPARRCNEIPS